MASTLSNYGESACVDFALGTSPASNRWLAVYTVMPDLETGLGGVEATGGSYARKPIAFSAGANTGAVAWTCGTDIAAGSYAGAGVMDALSGGNFWGGEPYGGVGTPVPRVLGIAGDVLNHAVGSVTLGIS